MRFTTNNLLLIIAKEKNLEIIHTFKILYARFAASL